MSDIPSLPTPGRSPLDEYLKKKLIGASTPIEQYLVHLTFAMTRFQLLEQELKIYLVVAKNRLRKGVSEIFEYRYDDEAIFNMPLKRLMNEFKAHGGDLGLALRIGSLIAKRNKVAHEGFVTVPEDVFGTLMAEQIETKLEEMKEIAKSVEGVPFLVSLETRKIVDREGLILMRPQPLDPGDSSTLPQGGLT